MSIEKEMLAGAVHLFCVPSGCGWGRGDRLTINYDSLKIREFTHTRGEMVDRIDSLILDELEHPETFRIFEVEFSDENLAEYLTALLMGDTSFPMEGVVISISSYTSAS